MVSDCLSVQRLENARRFEIFRNWIAYGIISLLLPINTQENA